MATLLGEVYSAPKVDEEYKEDKAITDRIYTVSYYVQGSSSEGPASILAVGGLPAIGDYVRINGELYTGAPCTKRSITEHDSNSNVWTVECEFNSAVNVQEQDQGQGQDPTDLTPKWSWSCDTIDRVVPKDVITGELIANKAEEPLPLTAPVAVPVLKIERYQWIFDPDTIYEYVNHVNSTEFWGADKKCAWMSSIEDSPETVNGVPLRKVTYTIRFMKDSWVEQVLNHGSRYKQFGPFPDGLVRYANCADESGSPTMRNLTINGGLLPLTNEPIFLPFNKYKTADFNKLNLGPW